MISGVEKRCRFCAVMAVFLYLFLFLFLGLSRHWGYMTSINDLGVADQVVWGLLNGEFFLNTSQLNRPIVWLGFHFHLIHLLFVPFYYFISSAIWFILAQAISLSMSAVPIYFLARRVLKSEQAGLIWMLVYLMNPTLLNTAAFDFAPIVLAVPMISISLLAVEMANFRWLILACLVILLCKEHLGIMVAGFGVLWWIQGKCWKTSMVLIMLGVMHSVLVLGLVMPKFSPTDTHIMFGDNLDYLSRYGWLGDSFSDIFQTIVFHPIYTTKIVILKFGGAKYLGSLLMFFLGLPLAAPQFLLPGIGDLAANMLSFNPLPRSILAYHNVTFVPLLAVAAIYGVKRISRQLNWINRRSSLQLSVLVLCTSVFSGYFLAPLPLPGARNNFAPKHMFQLPDPYIETIRKALGPDASVSVQANIGAHFSQRKEIYRYPNRVGEVDAVVLCLESPTKNINNIPVNLIKERKYLSNVLDGYFQMDRSEYVDSILSMIHEKAYGILLWNDPWLVLSRNAKTQKLQKDVERKLKQLREEWNIKGIND